MTAKVDIVTVAQEMRDNGVPAEIIKEVIKGLEKAAVEEKADRATKPKLKTQFVVLAADKEGILKGREILGWVVQLEESAPPQVALERLKAGVRSFNESRKGRKRPAKTLGDGIQAAASKHFKTNVEGQKTLVKTKVPVLIMSSDNSIDSSEATT